MYLIITIVSSLIFFVLLIILTLFWRNKLHETEKKLVKVRNFLQKKERFLSEVEKKISAGETNLADEKKKIQSHRRELESEKVKITNWEDKLFQKEKIITEQIEKNFQKEQKLESKEQELDKVQKIAENKIWEIAQMEPQEAKDILFAQLKEQIKDNLNKYTQQEIQKRKKNIEQKVTKIICLSLEKYSSELVFTHTVHHLLIDSEKDLGRIIGKDGRNIIFFQKITGTKIIIKKKNEGSKNEKQLIDISSFNSLRREIATRTLSRLVKEKRMTPLQIESVFQEVSGEVDEIIIQAGEEVLKELEITNLHPELTKYLGKLHFRTSYGQNDLEHCLEVAKLAGYIASEFDSLDVELAKRAGLLHDIGKAIENKDISHVKSGIALAEQYGEPPEVINAIASHHRDFPADNLYSLIVSAADTLSAARPGARGLQLEAHIARMESLENLAKNLPGIDKIYAFQSGREIWVIVDAQKISDYQMLEVSEIIRKKIREKIAIPGEVTVSVLRETKIVKKITTKGKMMINEQPKTKDEKKVIA